MNRIILLLAALFVFFTAQSELTQKEADGIVLERLCQETRPYTIYANKDVQQKWTITSINEEVLEINYKFWIYYIDYFDNTGLYLLVKWANGNLLEINVKYAKPDDLEEWRKIEPIEIPFTEYAEDTEGLWGYPYCRWKRHSYDDYEYWTNCTPEHTIGAQMDCYVTVVIINSNEDLEKYIECEDGNSYTEIDFSKYTLLLAHGIYPYRISPIDKSLQQLCTQSYVMKVKLHSSVAPSVGYWFVPIIVTKIADDSDIGLIVTHNN